MGKRGPKPTITEQKVYNAITKTGTRSGKFWKIAVTNLMGEIGCSHTGIRLAMKRFEKNGFLRSKSFTSRGTYIQFLRPPKPDQGK